MFKKLTSVLLAVAMLLSMTLVLTACGGKETADDGENTETVVEETAPKIGVVLVGDENEGYTYAHMEGIQQAAKALGIKDEQLVWKYNVAETEVCYDACMDCVDAGCTLVITNSYAHQSYTQQAATENPDVTFVAMTGDTGATSGLSNLKNAFTKVYESRYVSGVVAGMKIAELVEEGKLSDANYDADGKVKVGYVGAFPYPEVVSGFTGFFLGVKSVYENVSMEVQFTNSWFDPTAESEAANALMADGCVIIGQHADSTGAPSAVEAALAAGTVAYSVGYNVDMLSVAPNAALTSATNNWGVYYTYLFDAFLNGKEIATDWAEGYETGAVAITDLGSSCADGTAEKVAEVEAAIKSGELHVFDTATFTVGGAAMEDDNISDGYFHESEFRSAPYFGTIIDGITELNNQR